MPIDMPYELVKGGITGKSKSAVQQAIGKCFIFFYMLLIGRFGMSEKPVLYFWLLIIPLIDISCKSSIIARFLI